MDNSELPVFHEYQNSDCMYSYWPDTRVRQLLIDGKTRHYSKSSNRKESATVPLNNNTNIGHYPLYSKVKYPVPSDEKFRVFWRY